MGLRLPQYESMYYFPFVLYAFRELTRANGKVYCPPKQDSDFVHVMSQNLFIAEFSGVIYSRLCSVCLICVKMNIFRLLKIDAYHVEAFHCCYMVRTLTYKEQTESSNIFWQDTVKTSQSIHERSPRIASLLASSRGGFIRNKCEIRPGN